MTSATTDFAPAAALPRAVPLDPTKHVNYSVGMILGVDDFMQEFTFHHGRMRWLIRDLIGCGTVWGLAITFAEEDDDVVATVSPGAAISPCGDLICVSQAQCASLNDWLAEHATKVLDKIHPPDNSLSLFVVACYRECHTDEVPIPGEPCRSSKDLTAYSRVQDDFRLELRFEPPQQADEDATGDLIGWFRQIPIVSGPGTPLEEFAAGVRDAIEKAAKASKPPGLPLLLPSQPGALKLPADDIATYLRTALRVWATDGRPYLRHGGPGCECGCGGGCSGEAGPRSKPCEDAVLLGELALKIERSGAAGVRLAPRGWALRETNRPFLIPARLLQELALGGAPVSPAPSAPAPSPPPASPRIVAGGRVKASGQIEFAFGGLRVRKVEGTDDHFELSGWPGAGVRKRSVVSATPILAGRDLYSVDIFEPPPDIDHPARRARHVNLRVRRTDLGDRNAEFVGFVVQILDFSEVV